MYYRHFIYDDVKDRKIYTYTFICTHVYERAHIIAKSLVHRFCVDVSLLIKDKRTS